MSSNIEKHMCKMLKVESIINHKQLDEGIRNGWEELTNTYKKSNDTHYTIHDNHSNESFITKFRNMDKMDEELVLGILGVIRRHTVRKMFQCISTQPISESKDFSKHKHTYNAAGSTNLTSDYDLSIYGPYSNEIMWEMFKMFLGAWDKTIPHSFDTNIYTGASSYVNNKSGERMIIEDKKIKEFKNYDGEELFLMVPETKEDSECLFTWAGLKLIEAGIKPDDIKGKKLNSILVKSKKLNEVIKKNYCNNDKKYDELEKILNKKEYDDITKKTIKNYFLQYMFGIPTEEYIHKRVDKLVNPMPIQDIDLDQNNLFYLRGLNNFFSSEAYYTDATVYAIVFELQLHYHLELDSNTYLAAAIENLGDFLHHTKEGLKENMSKEDERKLLIKYSKYIYRINVMLKNLYKKKGDEEKRKHFKTISKQINEEVIPLRATYVIKNERGEFKDVFSKILHFNDNDNLKDYIEKIKNTYLKDINDAIDDNENQTLDEGGYKKEFIKKFRKIVNKKLKKNIKNNSMKKKKKKKKKNRTYKN